MHSRVSLRSSQSPTFTTMNTLTSFLAGAAATAGIAAAQFCEHQWEGEFAADPAAGGAQYLQDRQEGVAPPPLEIRPLIVNGPSENRVDLIFFGDGCTCDDIYKPGLFLARGRRGLCVPVPLLTRLLGRLGRYGGGEGQVLRRRTGPREQPHGWADFLRRAPPAELLGGVLAEHRCA